MLRDVRKRRNFDNASDAPAPGKQIGNMLIVNVLLCDSGMTELGSIKRG
jgi:hypothetical protein